MLPIVIQGGVRYLTKPLSKESARLLSFDCHSMSNSSDCLNYCISCILLILFTKSWIVTLQPTQSWNDYRSSKKISISLNPFASISCWTYPVRDVLVCAKTGNFLKYKKKEKFGEGGGKYKVKRFLRKYTYRKRNCWTCGVAERTDQWVREEDSFSVSTNFSL